VTLFVPFHANLLRFVLLPKSNNIMIVRKLRKIRGFVNLAFSLYESVALPTELNWLPNGTQPSFAGSPWQVICSGNGRNEAACKFVGTEQSQEKGLELEGCRFVC
jgi:hypothetical protein